MTHTVLIVDDDEDIRTFVEVSLSLAGFETVEAADGGTAVEQAVRHAPDVIVLDVMMPHVDGYAALRRIRQDGRISHIPVILLTAKTQTQDKLEGFEAGADDYLTKPFDPSELVARVQASLRRAADMRSLQPLTGLPGNMAIDKELERRVEGREPFALMHCDLNNFKAFNDHYGYARGDDVLVTFGRLLVDVARELGGAETFVGHVGGDDFVVITDLDLYEPMARQVCERFDAAVPELYDHEDRASGGIVVADRRGNRQSFPMVAVSIGIAPVRPGEHGRAERVVAAATEMKTHAKQQVRAGGSNYAADRRRGPGTALG